MATEYNGYKDLAEVDICREFDMFEVKVPVFFFGYSGIFGTQGCMLNTVIKFNPKNLPLT